MDLTPTPADLARDLEADLRLYEACRANPKMIVMGSEYVRASMDGWPTAIRLALTYRGLLRRWLEWYDTDEVPGYPGGELPADTRRLLREDKS